MPSRYRTPEEGTSHPAARAPLALTGWRHRIGIATRLVAVLVPAVVAGACGRTGLDAETTFDDVTDAGHTWTEATGGAASATSPAPRDAALVAPDASTFPDAWAPPDAAPGPTSTTGAPESPPPAKPPTTTPVPNCTPHDETCNGRDDDCDGKIDEDLAPIPCAGGGEQYCVAGRFSACPVRCETCIPGSERVCFLSYCTYWATQTCAADGRSFGTCREHHVPPECESVAHAHKDSIELEKCCVDNGYCCHDEYDLDHDGNRSEMIGRCDEVSCQ